MRLNLRTGSLKVCALRKSIPSLVVIENYFFWNSTACKPFLPPSRNIKPSFLMVFTSYSMFGKAAEAIAGWMLLKDMRGDVIWWRKR